MVAKIQAVLRQDKINELGQVPVYIKIVKNGQRRYVSTRQFIEEKYWLVKTETVSTTHPDHKNLNEKIGGLKGQLISQDNNETFTGNGTASASTIIDKAVGSDSTNLFTVVEAEVEERKKDVDDGKYSLTTFKNYTKILNRLEEYHGSRELPFSVITVDWLKKYKESLRKEKLSANYQNGIFRMIRTFIGMGIAKEIITLNPFIAFKDSMPKGKATEKEYLTLEELELLEKELPNLTGVKRESALYFLFGCYSGLRVSDWFKFDRKRHLAKHGIQLETTKTDTPMFVPYHPPLVRILDLMKDTPLTTKDVVINKEIKKIMASLEIDKHISTHCGRKTFAVTICSDNGISCEVCAMYMGITVKVCVENYYKVTMQRGIDEAVKCWLKK